MRDDGEARRLGRGGCIRYFGPVGNCAAAQKSAGILRQYVIGILTTIVVSSNEDMLAELAELASLRMLRRFSATTY